MRIATQPQSDRADWPRLIPAMLIAAALAVYANSTDGAFVFDDEIGILRAPEIQSLWPPSPNLLINRRVVGKLTLALNYAVNRTQPRGYHLVNLAIHVVAGLLVYAIARRSLLQWSQHKSELNRPHVGSDRSPPGERSGSPDSVSETSAAWLAFAIALIWVVHPLNTQAVTYIIQRFESLMALFFLLTLYTLIRGAQSKRPARWLAASWLACGLGMATKEVMIGAPLVMLLYDRAFLAGTFRSALRARWGYYAALFLFWVLPLIVGIGELTSRMASAGFSLGPIGPLDYLGSQPGVILQYLRLALWPDALCIDWLWPLPKSAAAIIIPGTVIIALLAATIWATVRAPAWGFLGAWFFIILAPTSSILPIADLMAEHRMYLPLVAVTTTIVLLANRLIQRASRKAADPGRTRAAVSVAILLAVVLSLGLRTAWRNADYRTPVKLWESTTRVRPYSFRAFNNYGAALLQTAQAEQPPSIPLLEKAAAAFDHASKLAPEDLDVLNGLGESLYHLRRYPEAQAAFARGETLAPADPRMRHKLGMSLMAQGLNDQAADAFRRSIKAHPGLVESRTTLAMILIRQGRAEEAAELLDEGVTVTPDEVKLWINLGGIRLAQGRFDQALTASERALALLPNDPELARRVAWIHAVAPALQNRDTARMTQLAIRAAEAAGGHPLFLDTLAAALARIGRFEQARRAAQDALARAKSMGNQPLADQIAARLRLYQSNRPFDDLVPATTQP